MSSFNFNSLHKRAHPASMGLFIVVAIAFVKTGSEVGNIKPLVHDRVPQPPASPTSPETPGAWELSTAF